MSAAGLALLWHPGFLRHLGVLAEFESQGALKSQARGWGQHLGLLNAVERIALVAGGASEGLSGPPRQGRLVRAEGM